MIEATGLALLHMIWQGAIIAGILAAALALMKRAGANSRYLISCAALFLLLAAGVFTALRSVSTAAPALSIAVPEASFTVRPYTPYIVLVWLAGVIVFTLRLVVSWRRTTALVAGDPTLELQHIVDTLSSRLGVDRAVRLIESAAVDVPSVVGWLRPVILLPLSSVTGLTHQQLEMVLAHELAHVRRHDFLVNALQSVAEALLFYHPAAWWISRQIRIERENCCDDLAVATCGNAVQYARALAQLEHLRVVASPAVAANGGSLFERIRRLVGGRAPDRDTRGWAAAAAILAIALIGGLTALPVIAERQKPAAPKPAPALPEPPEPPIAPIPRPVIAPIVPAVPAVPAVPVVTTRPGLFSIDELIAMRIHGVTPEDLEARQKRGEDHEPTRSRRNRSRSHRR